MSSKSWEVYWDGEGIAHVFMPVLNAAIWLEFVNNSLYCQFLVFLMHHNHNNLWQHCLQVWYVAPYMDCGCFRWRGDIVTFRNSGTRGIYALSFLCQGIVSTRCFVVNSVLNLWTSLCSQEWTTGFRMELTLQLDLTTMNIVLLSVNNFKLTFCPWKVIVIL